MITYAKLDDILAVGDAASLRHTVTWGLNACSMARIVNVQQDAAPPMTAHSCINYISTSTYIVHRTRADCNKNILPFCHPNRSGEFSTCASLVYGRYLNYARHDRMMSSTAL